MKKDYYIEFKIGCKIKLNEYFTDEEFDEAMEDAMSHLRLTNYDDYVLFDENGEIIE